jgi:hypothetical protein
MKVKALLKMLTLLPTDCEILIEDLGSGARDFVKVNYVNSNVKDKTVYLSFHGKEWFGGQDEEYHH